MIIEAKPLHKKKKRLAKKTSKDNSQDQSNQVGEINVTTGMINPTVSSGWVEM